MARVQIEGVGIVEVPDGTNEEVMASARAIRDKYKVDPVDYRAQGLGALASSGFQRSLEGLKGTVLDLAPALIGNIIGADDYAKQQLDEYKQRMEKAEEANPTAFKSYKQADSFGNALGYAAETVGELGPDVGAFVASLLTGSFGAGALARRGTAEVVEGLAGKLAARKGIELSVAREAINKQVTGALAEKSAKELGGKIGLGVASAGINIPDTFQSIYEDTGELRPDLALTIGSLVAALDTYLPAKLLSQLGSAGKAKLAEEMLKKSSVVPTTWKKEFGKALGMTAAGEGITEGTQESLQLFANQLAGSNDPFFSPENIDRIINSAIKGTIGGGVIGAPGAAVEASQIKADRLANIAAQPLQQEQEQVAPSARDLISKAREEKQRIATQQINQPPAGEKSAFETQQPDLLGFYKNLEQKPPQAAPKEVDPLAQRTRELFEEFVSKGMPPAQATRQAYEQARAEQQNDTMYSVESGEVVDPRIANPRQGVLQFAPPAPAAKPSTQISNQLQAAQKQREINLANQQAVQEKQAQVEKIAQQSQAQQQLNLAGLLPEQKTFRPPTANGAPAAQQQLDLFGERGRPSRTEGIRQGQTQSLQEDLTYQQPQISTVLDAETLKKTGLKPQSGYYKQLLGLDMANPDDQIKIGQILTAARQNTSMNQAPIESLRNQAFTGLAQQQSLPLTEATRGTKPPATVSRPNGKSVPVPNRPAPVTRRPAPTKPAGVGVFKNVATGLGAGEAVQSSALKPTVKKPLTDMEKALLQVERDLDKDEAAGKDVSKRRKELAEERAKLAEPKAEVKIEPKAEVKVEPKPKETKPETVKGLQEQIKFLTPMLQDPQAKTEITKTITDLNAQIAALKAAKSKKAKFREVSTEGVFTNKEVEDIAANTTKGWKNAPPIKTVESEKDLPDYIQEQMKQQGVKKIGGVFDEKTSTVYLVSRNLVNTQDVVETILHETVGHFGLQSILGSKYTSTMNNIYAGNKDVKDRADIKIANGMDKPLAVEEVLAEMAESNTNPTLLQKIINIIRQALRSIGIQFKDVTNGEIMQLIKDSHKYVTEGIGVPNGGNVRFGAVFNADAPIFYSKLAAMVAGAPKQFDSASEGQWRDWVYSNAGKNQVKQEELEYSGIFDYLNLGRDKNEKVSKEQVLQFLKEEGPKVTETILGEKNKNEAEINKLRKQSTKIRLEEKELRKQIISIVKKMISGKQLTESTMQDIATKVQLVRKEYVDIHDYTEEDAKKAIQPWVILKNYIQDGDIDSRNFKTEEGKKAFSEYKKIYKNQEELFLKQENIYYERKKLEADELPTKYDRWTFKRGNNLNNYRELILTLPTKKPKGKFTVMQNGDFATYSVNDENLNQIGPNFDTAAEAREWLADNKGGAIYTHSHWKGVDNPVVHIRFDEVSDAKGNSVLNVQELQSDWGQEYAKNIKPKIKIEERLDADRNKYFAASLDDVSVASGKTEEQARENAMIFWLENVKEDIADAPFITEPKSYTALAIKRLLRYAADNGYDKISFISGEEAHKRFPTSQDGKSTEEGMKTHYDVRIPSVVKEIFKKLGTDPNARTEKIKVDFDFKINELRVKDENGREQSYGDYYSTDVLYSDVLSIYRRRFNNPPHLVGDLIDPATNEVIMNEGQPIEESDIQDIERAGIDFKYILENYVYSPMEFDIVKTTSKGTKEQFTIDLNPETAEKVQRGQAMFSVKDNATLRNKPNVPGVTGADAQSIFDGFINKIATAPMMNQNRANALHEVLKKGVFGNALTVILSSLPVNVLGMEAERVGLKGATGIGRLIDEQSKYINGQNEKIEPLVRRAEAWVKQATPEMVKLFNSVVYGSTTSKADPTKEKTDYPEATQKDKTWNADYDRVKAEYIRLTESGKKLYVDMRNAYGAMYDEIVRAINERIETFSVDDTIKAKIKADIMAKLVAQGKIEPYFALTRKGNYWLSYNMRDKSGQVETYIEAFEYERARTRAIEELKKEGATGIEQFSKLAEYQYTRAPSGSFVNKVLEVLEGNKPKLPDNATADQKEKHKLALEKYEENTEEVMRLYISTMPETSFAQSFRKRQNVLGYKEDAVEALRDRLYSTTQQVGRMIYGAKLNKLMSDMKTLSKAMTKGADAKDNKLVNEYIKIFEKHIAANSANNNNIITKTANLVNTLTFNYQLGFNVSSAVVQLAQLPMVVMPYLAGDHSWTDTIKEIGAARRAFFASGYAKTAEMIGSKEKVTGKAMPSMSNYDFDDAKLPAEIRRLKTLYDLAAGEGQLNRSSFYDVLEVDGRKNILNTINTTSGWAFHHADRMNREISLMAAYNLQLAKLHGKGIKGQAAEDAAARYAVDVAKLTNGNIAAGNAPLISKNALGKVLFMYKGYGVSMYYLLFKITRDALQNQDKEVKKAAMRQIAGIYGTAALFSGLQGVPMFGMAAMIYNLFADDDEDDFETATRKYIGEFAYKGLINEITGLDVAGRIGLSDLIFRTNPTSQSATFQDAFLQTFGGPAYGAGSKIMRGLSKIQEGNIERGIEDILPSFLGNAMKSFRYGTEGATTMRGDPMIEDFSIFSIGAQALGFTPAELSLQQAINAKTKGIEKAILDEKNKLLQRYNISDRIGDVEAREEAKEKLMELNRKHPGLGINAETFERSSRAFLDASNRMKNGVQYSKKLEQEMLDNIAAYN
jgi:hypothetical protein